MDNTTQKRSVLSGYDAKLFGILLLPSWLSVTIAVFVGGIITAGTIVLSRYQGSSLHLYFLNYEAGRATSYQAASSNGILANPIIGNLPLLLFWGLMGLVVYMFATNVFSLFRQTAELKSELNYVNADRHTVIKTALVQVIIRLVVVGIWLPYILVFFHRILPYSVATALAGSAQTSIEVQIIYIALSFLVMFVALYVHTILLRLLLLRPRLFSKAIYS